MPLRKVQFGWRLSWVPSLSLKLFYSHFFLLISRRLCRPRKISVLMSCIWMDSSNPISCCWGPLSLECSEDLKVGWEWQLAMVSLVQFQGIFVDFIDSPKEGCTGYRPLQLSGTRISSIRFSLLRTGSCAHELRMTTCLGWVSWRHGDTPTAVYGVSSTL